MTHHLREALAKSEAARRDLERTNARLEQRQAELQSFAYVVFQSDL